MVGSDIFYDSSYRFVTYASITLSEKGLWSCIYTVYKTGHELRLLTRLMHCMTNTTFMNFAGPGCDIKYSVHKIR